MFSLSSLWRRGRLPVAAKTHCPLCDGNLSQQAKQLAAQGYYVAAVASARAELESRIRAVAAATHTDGDGFRGRWQTGQLAQFLCRRGVITSKQMNRIGKLTRRAGDVLHTYHGANCMRTRWIIAEVDALVADLHAGLEASRPRYSRSA